MKAPTSIAISKVNKNATCRIKPAGRFLFSMVLDMSFML